MRLSTPPPAAPARRTARRRLQPHRSAAATPASAASPCATGTSARTSTLCLNGYFAHDSRSGARFSARIARTGWMSGRGRWSVGENLAWGTGTRATPTAIVAAWMRSAGHRRNILNPRFRVIGIGIVRGAPVDDAAGATYTTDFGS